MTEKTTSQITAMKNDYNFGVEVEMNHISRRNAAKTAAEFFGTGRYENTATRNGYMTWSAYDQQGREWKFSRDASIAGPDDCRTEAITPILGWEDIPLLQELMRKLRNAGAVSTPNQGCGVHIHVSRKDGFAVNDIKALVNTMAAHDEQLIRAVGIAKTRTDSYCRTVNEDFLNLMHRKNPKTMEDLEDCWYNGNHARGGREQHYNSSGTAS